MLKGEVWVAQDGAGPCSEQPWLGAAAMVTETVAEQVVQALARGEAVAAVARAYGIERKNGAPVAESRSAWCTQRTRRRVAAGSVSRLAGAACARSQVQRVGALSRAV